MGHCSDDEGAMSGVDDKALDRILKTNKIFLWRIAPEYTNQPEESHYNLAVTR